MLRVFRHYIPTTLVELAAGDLLVITMAVLLASSIGPWMGFGPIWPKVLALAAIQLFALSLADLYRESGLTLSHREFLIRLVVASGASGLVLAAVGFALPDLRFARLAFMQIFGFLLPGLILWRLTWLRFRSRVDARQQVLVLGVSDMAVDIMRLQTTGARPFTVLGFLDDGPAAYENLPPATELLGKSRDLLNLVDELLPEVVLVALPDMRGTLPAAQLLECRLRGIRVEDWPSFFEKQTGKVLVTNLRPSWLIFSDGFVQTPLTRNIKRTTDFVLSLAGLLLTLPLMGLIGVAIKLMSRGPILIRQERVGQHGEIFVLNKFRSMRVDAEQAGGAVWATADDPRVTRLGKLLRRSRLDELPQLFNILAGDMSFIGPRPERPEFVRTLQQRIPFYMERLSVKPGLTGWAQIRHHYAASVEDTLEKLQYDLYYIKNVSPFLDLLILLGTIQVVLFARGSR